MEFDLQIRPGFNSDTVLLRSINALKRLGYFKTVNVNILKTDTPGVVDIELNVVST